MRSVSVEIVACVFNTSISNTKLRALKLGLISSYRLLIFYYREDYLSWNKTYVANKFKETYEEMKIKFLNTSLR